MVSVVDFPGKDPIRFRQQQTELPTMVGKSLIRRFASPRIRLQSHQCADVPIREGIDHRYGLTRRTRSR